MEDAHQIKDLERITRHDVKAIENFLRLKLAPTTLSDLIEFLHFGLTSEDVNNIAQALAIQRTSRNQVILPALDKILNQLADFIQKYKSTPMLARTHGQPAVPTTFGKEMAVFYSRLKKQYAQLESHHFEAKLTVRLAISTRFYPPRRKSIGQNLARNLFNNFGLESESRHHSNSSL